MREYQITQDAEEVQSETKHTPGPWYVAVSDKNGYWIDTDDEMIAKVPRSGDVEYANAQLIAAAPILLSMLTAVLPDLKQYAASILNRANSDREVHATCSVYDLLTRKIEGAEDAIEIATRK